MSKEEKYRLIEAYLTGDLQGENLHSFEKQLKSDPVLERELTLHKELNQAMIEEDVLNFRSKVKQVVENKSGNEAKKWYQNNTYLRIAAGLAFLILVLFIVNKLVFDSPSRVQLYADYYTPYDDLISGRTDQEDSLTLAMVFYNKQDYAKSADLLSKLDKTEKPLLLLYEGISWMNMDKTKKSEALLLELSELDSPFEIEARWYLALSYLKEGNIEKCKVVLTEIIDSPEKTSYTDLAKDLKDRL